MSLAISFGKFGGFYWHRGYTTRLCLGWIALTYFPADLDDILSSDSEWREQVRKGAKHE